MTRHYATDAEALDRAKISLGVYRRTEAGAPFANEVGEETYLCISAGRIWGRHEAVR